MGRTIVWQGPAELRRLLVPADSLTPHPRNPRRGNVAEIARSLERLGQMRAIVARAETKEIVAGNHTWRAATEILGWNRIAAHVFPMTDQQADAFLLADNRLGDIATYDDEALAALLVEQVELDLLGGTGWDPADVDAILARLEPVVPPDDSPRLRQSEDQRETVLLMDTDQHARFHERVKILAREYGTEGVSETVYRAVTEAAKNG